MGSETTERVLTIIQRKWNKLIETDNQFLYKHYRRLWEFIRNNSLCNEILQKSLHKFPKAQTDADNILNLKWAYFGDNVGGEEREIAAFIKLHDVLTGANRSWEDMYQIALDYVGPSQNGQQYYLNQFYSFFLTPILEHIQDNLNENIFVLQTLIRFRQRCEWFERTKMLESFESDTARGEKILQKYLYRYLFDQGIPIVMEPTSPSGEIDFIAAQSKFEKYCCEVKVFDLPRGKDKAYLLKGIETQLLHYLQDYNEPIGYMIIFKTGEKDVRFNLDVDQNVSFIDFGKKRIYLIVIDVFNYEKSGSSRNRVEPVVILKEDFLHK